MWNFKSMTDDDPMKFGFGSPAIKDKKKKKKAFNVHHMLLRSCSISFSPSLCYPSFLTISNQFFMMPSLYMCGYGVAGTGDDKLSVLEVGGLLLRCQNCVRCDHEEANSVDRSSEVKRKPI
ncbi:hypothetical protein IGI04_015563 [Brassica rapa subsp. trilocularis]|uniref:Uncharacterized protein n=1 Tax=Brassica rapa subsp. trilocularis TaxID=1813537 RepID=A0ABQ7MQW5_BRACM|nr:hypothetical protein IGI04_015563 [Brassica rapa subsp. trilocularis]